MTRTVFVLVWIVCVFVAAMTTTGYAQEPAQEPAPISTQQTGDEKRIVELEKQVKALTAKAKTLTPAEQAELMKTTLADTSKRVDEALFARICKQAKWKVRVVVDSNLKFTVTCER